MGRSEKEVKYENYSAKHLDYSVGRHPDSPENFIFWVNASILKTKKQKGAILHCQTLTEDTSMRPIVASVDETEIEILAKHC